VKAYLFAVARKRLAEHFRQSARRADLDLAVSSVADLRTGPATHVARRQRSELLREALARIPLDDQIAIELAYFEGPGPAMKEIAAVLESAENTVRSRLSRARDKLRAVLATLAFRFGLAMQVTAVRMTHGHDMTMPAGVMTVGAEWR